MILDVTDTWQKSISENEDLYLASGMKSIPWTVLLEERDRESSAQCCKCSALLGPARVVWGSGNGVSEFKKMESSEIVALEVCKGLLVPKWAHKQMYVWKRQRSKFCQGPETWRGLEVWKWGCKEEFIAGDVWAGIYTTAAIINSLLFLWVHSSWLCFHSLEWMDWDMMWWHVHVWHKWRVVNTFQSK